MLTEMIPESCPPCPGIRMETGITPFWLVSRACPIPLAIISSVRFQQSADYSRVFKWKSAQSLLWVCGSSSVEGSFSTSSKGKTGKRAKGKMENT